MTIANKASSRAKIEASQKSLVIDELISIPLSLHREQNP